MCLSVQLVEFQIYFAVPFGVPPMNMNHSDVLQQCSSLSVLLFLNSVRQVPNDAIVKCKSASACWGTQSGCQCDID